MTSTAAGSGRPRMTPVDGDSDTGPFDPRRRIVGIVVVFVLVASLLALQLLKLQVLDRERYVAWGEDQRLQTIPLEGHRGDIFDRNGEELAVSLPRPVIAADPLLVDDVLGAADALAPVLGRDVIELRTLLSSPGRFVYLERPADEDTASAVAALELPGVFITEEPRRFHPGGDHLARGVLGVVGVDNAGLSGLELLHEDELAGTPGRLEAERSIDGRTIPDGNREVVPATHGDAVHLTIDRALQFEVERALADQVTSTGSRGGVVIVTEPATGDVLAMASVTVDDDGQVVATSDNRAVTWIYEPASVMKAMTFAAVLDSGLATPTTARSVTDELQLYEEVFTDDEEYGTMSMTPTDILVRSSNTGTIGWAQDLGATALHDELADFGFGTVTGLGFPGESAGIFDDVDDWSGTTIATVAIGQGIAVTPMQMLAAYNVLANDGVYVEPRLISGFTDPDGVMHGAEAGDTRRVLSTDTATQVTEMLTRVVEGGTATRAAVPGYEIAAKTGTARKVQDSGGYQDAAGNFHYVATVAGFFPADDPEFSMIVILDEPSTSIFASAVSAPLFGELAAWAVRHFQVSPSTDLVLETAGADTAAIEPASDVSDSDEALGN